VSSGAPILALDSLRFDVRGENASLRAAIIGASQIQAATNDNRTSTQDILAAAGSDYSRIVGALYAQGYYGAVVRILIDGREAALIPPLSPPKHVSNVVVSVDPGRVFRFGKAQITPLVRGTKLPAGFASGQIAGSGLATEAVAAAAKQWQRAGYAKVRLADQSFTADHAANLLSATIRLAPGPVVTFGQLQPISGSTVRTDRIREIAGLPVGKKYTPDVLDTVAERLRRTGTFRSVRLSEAEKLGPGNTLDIAVDIADEKPRRFGVGGEVASTEGLTVSSFWLHRNLLGGAERLRVEGEVAGIGGQSSGIDYKLGARFDRPASFGPDTAFYASGRIEKLDEPSYQSSKAGIEIGASRIFSKQVSGEIGFGLNYARITDAFGRREFTYLTMPTRATWDYRDSKLNATKGYYFHLDGMPYVGFNGSASGARLAFDARSYRTLDAAGKLVAAARFQLGAVLGSDINSTQPDLLFFSGGGGTVRGQPYKALGVDLGGGNTTGGRSFVGLSVELRAKLKGKWGVVGFADAGYIGRESLYDGSGNWHTGAGVGLRYETGLGPIRLDAAIPLDGKTGKGFQVYVGIGQSF